MEFPCEKRTTLRFVSGQNGCPLFYLEIPRYTQTVIATSEQNVIIIL